MNMQRFLIYFWYYFTIQFQQIFFYWVIGMAIGSLISVFAKEKIHKLFVSICGKKLGLLGVIPASLLGIASPLCMYGTIPIAASFAGKDMSEDAQGERIAADFQAVLASFMMSSILLNPQILFYTAALGINVLIMRFIICFLGGIAAGIALRLFFRQKQFFNFSGFCAPENRDTDTNPFIRYLKSFLRNIKATALYLLIGVALSALFQCLVPAESFARLFGSNRPFGILMAATIGVPLYVCGGGTIPMLLQWINHGMSLGGAAAFMLSGPAIKITNLSALKTVLGIKHFLFYILFSVLFSFLCGLFIDLFN